MNDLTDEVKKLREERERLLFLVNSLRLPLRVDPTISNFDRVRILDAMQNPALRVALLRDKYRTAFNGLEEIVSTECNAPAVASAAMKRCVDMGDMSDMS